jgi:hypothetical protein
VSVNFEQSRKRVHFHPDVVDPVHRDSEYFRIGSWHYQPRSENGPVAEQPDSVPRFELRPLGDEEHVAYETMQCVIYQPPEERILKKYFEEGDGILWIPIREGDGWRVPFDRDWFASQAVGWVTHYRSLPNVSAKADDLLKAKCSSLLKARLLAVPSFFKGSFFVVVDLMKWIFAKVMKRPNKDMAYHQLKAQCHGVRLSGMALFSPNRALEKYIELMRPEGSKFLDQLELNEPVVEIPCEIPEKFKISEEYPVLL